MLVGYHKGGSHVHPLDLYFLKIKNDAKYIVIHID